MDSACSLDGFSISAFPPLELLGGRSPSLGRPCSDPFSICDLPATTALPMPSTASSVALKVLIAALPVPVSCSDRQICQNDVGMPQAEHDPLCTWQTTTLPRLLHSQPLFEQACQKTTLRTPHAPRRTHPCLQLPASAGCPPQRARRLNARAEAPPSLLLMPGPLRVALRGVDPPGRGFSGGLAGLWRSCVQECAFCS